MSNKVEDFPSLNPNIKQMPKKQQGPTYAQLANDWKTHDEYMKGISAEEQSQPKFHKKYEENKFPPINVPTFEKCDRFEDEEVVEDEVETEASEDEEFVLMEIIGSCAVY